MSFQFQRPVPQSTNNSSGSGIFDINEYHFKLMRHSGPDYDELIIPLSLYAFNRLSPSDQLEHLKEIRCSHNVEELDFAGLFKKLDYFDQLQFLSQVLNHFKCVRLIPSFKQLDADHQQQVIDQMAYVTQENHRNPEETEGDFRLRSFIQLYKSGHTWNVEKLLARGDTKEHGDDQQEETFEDKVSDWKSGFYEFFVGLSYIWFQGQWTSGQDMMIEQLSEGLAGGVVEIEEDFKIARFTELCKKVVDFRVQEKFLDNALEKLQRWEYCMLILEPQDTDGAAELLSDLSTLGFGLLSAKYQDHKIEELSNKVGKVMKGLRYLSKVLTQNKEERHDLPEEAIRMRRFRELLDQVSVLTRIDVFKELRKVLSKQRSYSEAVHFFSGLGSEDQIELIEKLLHKVSEPITEKVFGESEEDLRLRRFKNVCTKHLSTRDYIAWSEADKERVRQCTSDHNEEESPYAEFLFDVSVTWFKARCANYQRNPVQVILSGEVEVTEKLPKESEEAFRLRRFAESFKRLEFTSKESIINYIQSTLFEDLGYPVSDVCVLNLNSYKPSAVGRGSFDSEWIKMKLPNLQGQGAAAATAQVVSAAGSATTTQTGGIVIRK